MRFPSALIANPDSRRSLYLMITMAMFAWIVSMNHCVALASGSFDSSKIDSKKIDASRAARSIKGKWYDHEKGSYVAPSVSPNRDNDIRKNGTIDSSRTDFGILEKIFEFIKALIGGIGAMFFYLGYVAILILVILLILAIVYMTASFVRAYRGVDVTPTTKKIEIDPAKIEELPFEAVAMTGDPLAVCRKLAQEGKFDEAILYLYAYELLAMDSARKIHLHKGKTNRMYLREIEGRAALRAVVALTVDKFEFVYFGKHSLSKQSFLESWNQLDEFHGLIAQSAESNEKAINEPAVVGGMV